MSIRSTASAEDRFLNKLLSALDIIEKSPAGFGRAVENELVPFELHEYVVRPYRILYRVEGDRVQILHVRHGASRAARPHHLQ